MTLPETLIAAGVIALALAIAALGIASIRTDLKQRRTRDLLVTLDAALEAYHQAAGDWPEVQAGRESHASELGVTDAQRRARHAESGSTDAAEPVIAALANVPTSRERLEHIPAELRVSPEELATKGLNQPAAAQPAWGTVQDAWGRRLHCLTADSAAPVDRQAVAANGGKPIFVSAGDNGEFSSKDGSEAADNLRSDELPR
jgi:type II secretory pathway pseudopilin PulG